MSFLVVICFLAFIVFAIMGIFSVMRRKPTTKRNFLLSLVSLVLMIVFAIVSGSSESDETLKSADTSTKAATNSGEKSTNVIDATANSAENTQNDAEQVKANAEAKAAADAEAKKKADAEAKADADAKAKEAAAVKAKQDAALAQMVKTVDEVEGITWYQDKEAPEYINENGIFAYFGTKDGEVLSGLHLKIQYTGDTWIFIKNYIFNIDGQKFEIDPGYMGAERDMSTDINNPGVWEYYDETLDKSQIKMLNQIIASEKTILRLEGDQRKEDRTISASQKAALKRALDAYIAAGGEV